MKKVDGVFIKVTVTLMTILLVGIFSQLLAVSQDSSPQKGGTLTYPYPYTTVPVMDPQKANSMGAITISALVAETLVRVEEGKLIGVLAESWDISGDAMVYTLYIRKNVKFHNGKLLTAEAVKENIERMADPANKLPCIGSANRVASMEVVDDYTLKINLKGPDPNFLALFAGDPATFICEPSSWQNFKEGDALAGTGPFKYALEEYDPESKLVMERFSDYWRGEPYLDKVVVRISADLSASIMELEKGVFDMVRLVPWKDAARLQAEGFKVYPYGRISWESIMINLKTVNDVRLRKAINYAFNKEALLDSPTTLAGFGIPQYSIAYPGTYLYNDKVGYHYNPETASEIMDEAGWVDTNGDGIREIDGKDIDLLFPTPTGLLAWEQCTQMIQSMLKEVGIGSHIKVVPTGTFYNAVRIGDYDIAWWLDGVVGIPPIATRQFDCREYWAGTQVCWQDVQTLLEKADSTLDKEKQAALYKQLQQIHYDRAMEALGVWKQQLYVASPKLHNLKINDLGSIYDAWSWWKEN